MDSPDCLLIFLSISIFLLFSFSVFHFLVISYHALAITLNFDMWSDITEVITHIII